MSVGWKAIAGGDWHRATGCGWEVCAFDSGLIVEFGLRPKLRLQGDYGDDWANLLDGIATVLCTHISSDIEVDEVKAAIDDAIERSIVGPVEEGAVS